MEVHHHSHTARRKWTHSFWEFLMLFLAAIVIHIKKKRFEKIIELIIKKYFLK